MIHVIVYLKIFKLPEGHNLILVNSHLTDVNLIFLIVKIIEIQVTCISNLYEFILVFQAPSILHAKVILQVKYITSSRVDACNIHSELLQGKLFS